jgi:hypothetical protein
MGVTIDGFCIRNSTPGVNDGVAVDEFIPGGGTWGDATAGARPAHRAQLAAAATAKAAAGAAVAPVTGGGLDSQLIQARAATAPPAQTPSIPAAEQGPAGEKMPQPVPAAAPPAPPAVG